MYCVIRATIDLPTYLCCSCAHEQKAAHAWPTIGVVGRRG